MYFQEAAKVQLQHIPYKGAGPVVPDLVAGVVDLAFMAPAAVQGLVNQGKLRIIAVSGAKRSPHLPDVPAIAETLPGFALDGWFAVIGPKNLPAGVLQKLQRSINQIIVSDSFKSQLAQEGAVPLSTTPQALRTFMEADYQKMGRLVRNSGTVID
jgi:tripartite-type tricarboxylate transporter receptor subunit TctC